MPSHLLTANVTFTIAQQIQPDVSAAMAGDMQAFSRLIRRCQNSVSSIALAIVKDLDASEEICQQVFIAAWQQLHSLQNPDSFLPWVRQITRYRAYNYLRDSHEKLTERGEHAEALLAAFASDSDPVTDFIRAEHIAIIREFLAELPAESREIVLLFYREEQNSQHVAQLLGLNESNVRKKLQRVRELLKSQLLHRYGKLILSTAPGLGLSSAIVSTLLLSSPPVAAATVSATASQSSGLAKLSWLFSGAMLGALGGVMGVILGMRAALTNATSLTEHKQLIRLRNAAIGWVVCCGVLLTFAYELTAGAIAPIVAFSVFMAGLGYLQYKVWQAIKPRLLVKAQHSAAAQRQYRRTILWCWFSILGGGAMGMIGVVAGLVNSSRWFWG